MQTTSTGRSRLSIRFGDGSPLRQTIARKALWSVHGPSRKCCHPRAMSEMHLLADVGLLAIATKKVRPKTNGLGQRTMFAKWRGNKVKRFYSSEAAND